MGDTRLSFRSTPVASSRSPVVETQRELEVARRELLSSAHHIRDDVRALADWRRPIRERPWLFIGSALALGFALAALHRRRGAA